jgi:hypothetical protein
MKKILIYISLFCSLNVSGQILPGVIASGYVASATTLADKTVFWLPITETTGTTLNDSKGDHDYTIISGTLANPGITFDGDQDYARRAYDATIAVGSAVTIAAWIKPGEVASGGMLFALHNTATPYSPIRYYQALTHLTFEVTTAGGVVYNTSTGHTFVVGTTYFVVGVYNGSTIKVYVNAVDRTNGTSSQTGSVSTSNDYSYIGIKDGSINDWTGTMYAIGVFNYALSAAEITTLYNSGTILNYPFE